MALNIKFQSASGGPNPKQIDKNGLEVKVGTLVFFNHLTNYHLTKKIQPLDPNPITYGQPQRLSKSSGRIYATIIAFDKSRSSVRHTVWRMGADKSNHYNKNFDVVAPFMVHNY